VSRIAAIDERRLSTTLLGRSIAVIGLLALGGCGSSSLVVPNTSTVAQTSGSTQTATTATPKPPHKRQPKPAHKRQPKPAHPATTKTTTGHFAAGYPGTFETSFLTRCQAKSGNVTACTCLLKNVENEVPYSTVVSSIHLIAAGKRPKWYSRAAQGCLGAA
jgi:hypothetical protein